jgi:hypothetical protein
MKKSITYIAAMLITTVGFSSCDDNFEQPPLSSYTATATIEANKVALSAPMLQATSTRKSPLKTRPVALSSQSTLPSSTKPTNMAKW